MEINFVLLSRKTQLVIFVSINFVANKIGKNIVYITIRVNTQVRKIYKIKINVQ